MNIGLWVRSLFLVAAMVAAAVFATLFSFNHFSTVDEKLPDRCTPVVGISGPVDLQVDRARGIAFVSSLDRTEERPRRGGIHVVDINDPLNGSNWRDRTRGKPEIFEPYGLSYYNEDGVQRLFVVNAATDAVEVFDVLPSGDLDHLETLSEPRLTSPNDLVATGPRAFYVTNDVGAGRTSLLGKLMFLSRASDGKIMYFNGISWRVVASGLQFANGIAMSADGNKLFAAESAGMGVTSFDRDRRTGLVERAESIGVGFATDNLNLTRDGDIIVSGINKPLGLPLHQRDPSVHVPSSVARLSASFEIKDHPEQTLFRTSGDLLSAATTADVFQNKLLIGALMEDKFLICDLDQ
ncbi:MAG: SMP-30/gluconolactonase/LRE family protein [Pseudomonadota bacterium]